MIKEGKFVTDVICHTVGADGVLLTIVYLYDSNTMQLIRIATHGDRVKTDIIFDLQKLIEVKSGTVQEKLEFLRKLKDYDILGPVSRMNTEHYGHYIILKQLEELDPKIKYYIPKCTFGASDYLRNRISMRALFILILFDDPYFETIASLTHPGFLESMISSYPIWSALTAEEKKRFVRLISMYRSAPDFIEYVSASITCTDELGTRIPYVSGKKLLQLCKYPRYCTTIVKTTLGMPPACMINEKDIDWLIRHGYDTHIKIRKYVKYLEYMYVDNWDLQNEYVRRNTHWHDTYKRYRTNELDASAEARAERARLRKLSRAQRCQEGLDKAGYAAKAIAPQKFGDWTFEVSADANDWVVQADKLHQCIVRLSYYKRRDATIIFCKKDREPYATFEVCDESKVIIQEFKDEANREDMIPEQECHDACTKFIKANWK